MTGYGDVGHALVTGGVDKVIFVGSVGVGKMVMKAASESVGHLLIRESIHIPIQEHARASTHTPTHTATLA